MILNVTHETSYQFDEPVRYGLQRVRITPISGPTQSVTQWDLSYANCTPQVSYVDFLGNQVNLIRIDDETKSIVIRAAGQVDTHRNDGVIGPQSNGLPLWYFAKSTELTTIGTGIEALAASVAEEDNPVARLHRLSAAILDVVNYELGGTEPETTAEEVLQAGTGVCQDHAHVFVAAARSLDIPARYVSGYLLLDDTVQQSAGHAWAEAWVDGLGWVGFDVSNGISADERYIRVAVGRDYLEAAPITGLRYGSGGEQMGVALAVQQ